jgi:hypothetical protein
MFELVTLGAKGDAFEFVMLVIIDDVIEDFFWVAVETPQAENDMIEVNKVMTLKVFVFAATQAQRAFVTCHPICIGQGSSDTPVK